MKQLICIIIVFLTSGICFISCKTQYVPVESARTEYRDRWRTDSIYNRDSIFLSVRGDTVWMEKYITRYRTGWCAIRFCAWTASPFPLRWRSAYMWKSLFHGGNRSLCGLVELVCYYLFFLLYILEVRDTGELVN